MHVSLTALYPKLSWGDYSISRTKILYIRCCIYAVVMLLTFILIIISILSLPHSFIPGLKPSFTANPSHRILHFSSFWTDYGFPELFTNTSEHVRFYFLVYLFSTFQLSVSCGRLSWLSYRIVHTSERLHVVLNAVISISRRCLESTLFCYCPT